MTPFAIALALFAQAPEVAAAPPPPAPVEDRIPNGAPRDDYPFVAWCYGNLRGYLDMHDEVMPEVTRIEREFRRPGSNLADDLKVYADMQADGQAKLKLFQDSMTAAEKASLRPINAVGAAAIRQGASAWLSAPGATAASKAQAWMGWTLPARCEATARSLQQKSLLMGPAFKPAAAD